METVFPSTIVLQTLGVSSQSTTFNVGGVSGDDEDAGVLTDIDDEDTSRAEEGGRLMDSDEGGVAIADDEGGGVNVLSGWLGEPLSQALNASAAKIIGERNIFFMPTPLG